MPVPAETIRKALLIAFPKGEIEVIDLAGDNDHYEVRVMADEFEGISLVKQHKMVMDALGSMVGKELHALAIKTKSKK